MNKLEEKELKEKRSIFYAAGLFFSNNKNLPDKIEIQNTLLGENLDFFNKGVNLDSFKSLKKHNQINNHNQENPKFNK